MRRAGGQRRWRHLTLLAALACLVLVSPAAAADPLEGIWSLDEDTSAQLSISQPTPGSFIGVSTADSSPSGGCPVPKGTTILRLTGSQGRYTGTAQFYNVPACDSFEADATVITKFDGSSFTVSTLAEFHYSRVIVNPGPPLIPGPTFIGPPEPLLRGSPDRVAGKLYMAWIGDDLNCLNLVTCNSLQAQDRLMWYIGVGALTKGTDRLAKPFLKPLANRIMAPARALFEKYGPAIQSGSAKALADFQRQLSKLAISASANFKLPASVQAKIDATRIFAVLKPGGNYPGVVKNGILTVPKSSDVVALYRQLKIGTTNYVPKTALKGQARKLPSGGVVTLRNGVSSETVGPTIQLPKVPGLPIRKVKAADHTP